MAQRADKREGSRAWRAVFVVALVVFAASLTALAVIAFSYLQGQVKYGNVAKDAGFEAESVDRAEISQLHVDWDALLAINPDTVAWLYIPHTGINYPVVQGPDNEYYLSYDFDGDEGWLAHYGTIFVDFRNKRGWTDPQYFLYGHHMNDGSMFADLVGFSDQGRFDECRAIYLLSPQGNFRLRSYAMVHVGADDAIVQTTFASPEDMAAYVQDKIDNSIVNPGEIPPASAIVKSFAFATCDNLSGDGRLILYAYVEETSAEGLTGELGLVTEDGQTTGFANDLTTEEGS